MQKNQMSGRVVAGVILIGLGVLFLLGTLGLSVWGLWPFFIILPGALMLVPALTGDGKSAGLAVPGAVVTGTGLILLYQSITGNWGSWLYIWTLYPAFFGFGMWVTGRNSGDAQAQRAGKTAMFVGIAGFVLFGLCAGGFGWWPLVIIGIGVWMLLRAMGVKLPAMGEIDFSAFSAAPPPDAPEPARRAGKAPHAPELPAPPDMPGSVTGQAEEDKAEVQRDLKEKDSDKFIDWLAQADDDDE
ncbi:MAG: hypothetical protein JXB47_14065 [Anaerolineae bacterium]|nr:hypothetical protein [Anaerolineae bacterium]